jgi:hypothetical protein
MARRWSHGVPAPKPVSPLALLAHGGQLSKDSPTAALPLSTEISLVISTAPADLDPLASSLPRESEQREASPAWPKQADSSDRQGATTQRVTIGTTGA